MAVNTVEKEADNMVVVAVGGYNMPVAPDIYGLVAELACPSPLQ